MFRNSRRIAAVGAVAALSMVLAACSGSSDDQKGDSGGGDSSAVVSEMQQLIDANSAQPEFKDPGPSLDAAQLKGRTIAIVAVDMRVPAIAEVAGDVKKVAAELGMTTTLFDAKSTAGGMQQGMQQAINNGADAIISDGLAIQLVTKEIKAAKDKGIPTIDVINTPPVAGQPGQGSDPNIFGNVAPDSRLAGELVAATSIVQTDGKAKVALMNTSELTVAPTIIKGMEDTIAKCDDCEVLTTTDTSLNDWSTGIPGVTATTIRSHPDLNFLLPIYDAMAIFATAGVQQAQATGKVKIASFNGTAAALDLVKKGDVLVADVVQNNEWAAWAAVDQAMRGMLKMEPADPVLPTRYVDTESIKDLDTSSPATVYAGLFGDGYKSGYRALWGLQ